MGAGASSQQNEKKTKTIELKPKKGQQGNFV